MPCSRTRKVGSQATMPNVVIVFSTVAMTINRIGSEVQIAAAVWRRRAKPGAAGVSAALSRCAGSGTVNRMSAASRRPGRPASNSAARQP